MNRDEGFTLEERVRAWVRGIGGGIWRFLLIAALIAGAVYVVGRLRVMLAYVFVAATLAYVIRPLAGWLSRQGWFTAFHDAIAGFLFAFARPLLALRARLSRQTLPPIRTIRLLLHTRRVIATFYVLVLLFVGGYYSLKFTLNPFINELTRVGQNWPIHQARFEKYGEDLRKWYESHVTLEWRDKIAQQLEQNSIESDVQKQVTAWVGTLGRRFGEIAHHVVEIVLLPVLAFYFALDSKKLKHEAVGALPPRRRREVLRIIHEFNRIMHSFVVGQFILCLIAGIVVGVGLWWLGVPYPLTLGLLAGFTRAIPIIGPIIGGIPIIFLALVSQGLGVALGVLAFFTFLHFAESKFIMPYLIGERMKLHPVVIILVLLVGQEFGGLLGMFFAAPIAAILRVIVRRYWLRRFAAPRRELPLPEETPSGVL